MDDIINLIEDKLHITKSSGINIQAFCPIHENPSTSRTPSFSLNVENGLWHCFGCKKSGNLRQLLNILELPKNEIDSIVGPLDKNKGYSKKKNLGKWHARFRTDDPYLVEPVLPESLLGIYDFAPVKLINAGFCEKILKYLNIGYDRKFKRITFPIRDLYGNLVGLAGRETRPNVSPKYKIYQGGTKINGKYKPGEFGEEFDNLFPGYHLKNKLTLWNAHLAKEGHERDLIVVEGYKDCIWVKQKGWDNVVALMGSAMSHQQLDIICHIMDGTVYFMLDGDDAGMRGTIKYGSQIAKYRKVRVCEVPSSKQPDDLSREELSSIIRNARRFNKWLQHVEEREEKRPDVPKQRIE